MSQKSVSIFCSHKLSSHNMRSQRSCSEKPKMKGSLNLFSCITTGHHIAFFFPFFLSKTGNELTEAFMIDTKEWVLYSQKKVSAEAEPLLPVGVLSAFGKYKWYSPLSHVLEEVTIAAFLTFFIKNHRIMKP